MEEKLAAVCKDAAPLQDEFSRVPTEFKGRVQNGVTVMNSAIGFVKLAIAKPEHLRIHDPAEQGLSGKSPAAMLRQQTAISDRVQSILERRNKTGKARVLAAVQAYVVFGWGWALGAPTQKQLQLQTHPDVRGIVDSDNNCAEKEGIALMTDQFKKHKAAMTELWNMGKSVSKEVKSALSALKASIKQRSGKVAAKLVEGSGAGVGTSDAKRSDGDVFFQVAPEHCTVAPAFDSTTHLTRQFAEVAEDDVTATPYMFRCMPQQRSF